MKPSMVFEKSGPKYTATHCEQYENDTLKLATALLEDSEQPDLKHLDTLDVTSLLKIKGWINNEQDATNILGKYTKLFFKNNKTFPVQEQNALKDKIKQLVIKLNNDKTTDKDLTEDEKNTFEQYMFCLVKDKSPNRNYKIDNLDKLKTEQSSIKINNMKLAFPRDLKLLESTLALISKAKNDRHLKDVGLDDIKQRYCEKLLHDIKQDLSKTTKNCEIIIVDDDWKTDEEVCRGIAMRDKAHERHEGHAIILEKSQLDMLNEKSLQELDLSHVYKISTLMHVIPEQNKEKTNELCGKIVQLTRACSASSDCHLREITLRQCFSAGHRTAQTSDESYARVPDAVEPGAEAKEEIAAILSHRTKYFKAELHKLKQTHYELQTRPTHPVDSGLFVDKNALLAKLATDLGNDNDIKEKIPDLLVKGYYGPVTPSPEEPENAYIRPGSEKAAADTALPNRFYKATRIAPFHSNESQSLPEHASRPGGRRNPSS